MKRKYSIVAFALVCAFVMNYKIGNSKISQPPAGNDGDPTTFPFAGQTCTQCHSGAAHSAIGHVDITFDDGTNAVPVDSFSYTPATQYTVTFAPSITATRYGFQLAALQTGNTNAGTLAVTNTGNTSLTTGINTKYIGHKNANTNKTWSFKWTAPATDVGNVTLYYTFVGANGNNSESGDVVYKGNNVVSASQVSGIDNVIMPVSNLIVFPNPAVNTLNVSYTADGIATSTEATLYNLYGQAVKHDVLSITTGVVNQAMDVKGLPQGVYLLQVKAGEKQSTIKVAVQ